MKIPRDIHENSAPFNMALATLERISDILKKITQTLSEPSLPLDIKQTRHLSLVKELYINSAPLLKDEVIEKFKVILTLHPSIKKVIEHHSGRSSVVLGNTNQYSFELEKTLLWYTVKIQGELQKEKYFMPPKADPTSGWKQN